MDFSALGTNGSGLGLDLGAVVVDLGALILNHGVLERDLGALGVDLVVRIDLGVLGMGVYRLGMNLNAPEADIMDLVFLG